MATNGPAPTLQLLSCSSISSSSTSPSCCCTFPPGPVLGSVRRRSRRTAPASSVTRLLGSDLAAAVLRTVLLRCPLLLFGRSASDP